MHFSESGRWYPLFLRHCYTSHGVRNADLKVMKFCSPFRGHAHQTSTLRTSTVTLIASVCLRVGKTQEPGLWQHGDAGLWTHFATICNILFFFVVYSRFYLLFYLTCLGCSYTFFLVLFLLKCSTFVLFFCSVSDLATNLYHPPCFTSLPCYFHHPILSSFIFSLISIVNLSIEWLVFI